MVADISFIVGLYDFYFIFYEYDVINYNFYYVILVVHIVGLCNNLYAFRIREES